MMKRPAVVHWLLLMAFLGIARAGEPLEPDQAFAFSARALDVGTVRAQWDIADGYYLNRSKIRFETGAAGIRLGEPRLPTGKIKQDEYFGTYESYRDRLIVDIPVTREAGAPEHFELIAHSQGCADIGLCYPPHQQRAQITLAAAEGGAGGALAKLKDLGARLGLSRSEPRFLEPDQAFIFSARAADAGTLIARWDITDEYYLYRDKFSFRLLDAPATELGAPLKPRGKMKVDEAFGEMEVYYGQAEIRLPLLHAGAAPQRLTLEAQYQGCADAGLCYPPITKTFELLLPAAGATGNVTAAAPAADPEPLSEQDQLAQSLASGTGLAIIATFFGLGLLLAFTPCVFPMIPILSSIIVKQGDELTTRHAFTLSLTYVLAMSLTYTVAGVFAGLFGGNLQATFQNPWVLGSFSLVFVLLALSMFGFYEIQLPARLQSRLSEMSNRQERGSLAGTAIMGFLSALIVGPCVAPPLAGALIYIGQTGDALLGGLALFALSLGMGAPLLAIGTSAGKLLPRAGGWMETIKAVFGVLLLAVAIWMLERIVPAAVNLLLWAALLIVSGIYLGALEPVGHGAGGWRKLWKGTGLLFLIYGAALVVGAASGGHDVLRPLQGLSAGGGQGGAAESRALHFKTVKTVAELDAELARASGQGKPVMLDFYADWCISCKEMERDTFGDPGVQQALAGFVLLQADVTGNDAADKALLKRFELFGPPSIIFFDRSGQERRNLRLVGFMEAEPFRAHLQRAAN